MYTRIHIHTLSLYIGYIEKRAEDQPAQPPRRALREGLGLEGLWCCNAPQISVGDFHAIFGGEA